jgi:hypothetical protein
MRKNGVRELSFTQNGQIGRQSSQQYANLYQSQPNSREQSCHLHSPRESCREARWMPWNYRDQFPGEPGSGKGVDDGPSGP